MKNYTQTQFKNGTRLYTPQGDSEEKECECYCHTKPKGFFLSKCPMNCSHCEHCQKSNEERCVKCGTPKRFNEVDKWCPNPNCKYFEDYEVISYKDCQQPDQPRESKWIEELEDDYVWEMLMQFTDVDYENREEVEKWKTNRNIARIEKSYKEILVRFIRNLLSSQQERLAQKIKGMRKLREFEINGQIARGYDACEYNGAINDVLELLQAEEE